MMEADTKILETALRQAYEALDELICASTDGIGRPISPHPKVLMKARALLPQGHKSALSKPAR